MKGVAEQQLTLEIKGKEPVGWDGVGGWQWEDLLNRPLHFFHSADALQVLDPMLGLQQETTQGICLYGADILLGKDKNKQEN